MQLLYFDKDSGSGYLDLSQEGDELSYSYPLDPKYGDIIFDIGKNGKITGIDIFSLSKEIFEKKVYKNKNIYFFNQCNNKFETEAHTNNTKYYSKNGLFGKIKIEYTKQYIIKSIAIEKSIISNPEK